MIYVELAAEMAGKFPPLAVLCIHPHNLNVRGTSSKVKSTLNGKQAEPTSQRCFLYINKPQQKIQVEVSFKQGRPRQHRAVWIQLQSLR